MNRVLENLLYYVRHTIIANEDGEDFALSRHCIDSLCSLGVLEKVGRAKWAVTNDADSVYEQLGYLKASLENQTNND